MLALAAANGVSVVLFAALYATAGARLMSQGAFVVCLVVIVVLVTTLWVRVEARHRELGPVRRIGRVAAGLVIVLLGVPIVVLMPVFWLDTQLPPDAQFTRYLGPIMTVVLISLALLVVVNAMGAIIALARAALPGAAARRLFLLAFVGYVLLDLGCPLVPGAFTFDPARSVDAVSAYRIRPAALPRVAAAPPAMTPDPVRAETAGHAPEAPAVPPPVSWRRHVGRDDALASDPRLSVEAD